GGTRMRSRIVNPKRRQPRLRSARLALAALAALIAAGDHADAIERRGDGAVEPIERRTAGEPIMAIVSLQSQRLAVYAANGWILRAPVSSGQRGRETPAGIFSVIQKEAEHYSNLYDDAFMPHMQRITWSGIALHGGPLPGYPASHGCVRMRFDFAARLFDETRFGLRGIVAPSDVAPVEIAHPVLALSSPGGGASAAEWQGKWTAAKTELHPSRDRVATGRQAAAMVEAPRAPEAEAAAQVARDLKPISVLISRKTQRLYVRQAFEPILESPVTILDP